jgi:diguanylate cyclase (GGDEF)-like protein
VPVAEKILIVDDDPLVRTSLRDILESWGYAVSEAQDGNDAFNRVLIDEPDLILLDVNMPKLNGLELCRKLKQNPFRSNIPIIFISGRDSTQDAIRGLELGAEDYISKFFDPEELKWRVRARLREARQHIGANPLTKLPGNLAIEEEIRVRVESGKKFAICYVDLDNFKGYNDVYGYAAGDEVIQLLARILKNLVIRSGDTTSFVGHVGGDDFMIITDPESIEDICQKIIKRFDDAIVVHYREEDRERGYILSEDRTGSSVQFPIMTLSLSVTTNVHRLFTSHLQVSEILTEIKHRLKQMPGSNYLIDQRKDPL